MRIMDDYGHIDDETPSFAISLYEEYRNMGIGTALMRDMLEFLKNKGYRRTSLSVQKVNMRFVCIRKWVLKSLTKMKKKDMCKLQNQSGLLQA